MADERLRDVLERIDATTERVRLEFERNRAFHRMVVDRYDQLTRDVERRWEEESRRREEAHREMIAGMRRRTDEMRREIRAQTEAIFRILDRLDNGGGANPATP